jgi:hypothetical protein
VDLQKPLWLLRSITLSVYIRGHVSTSAKNGARYRATEYISTIERCLEEMQSHRDSLMRPGIRSSTNSLSSCVRILCKCMRYFHNA